MDKVKIFDINEMEWKKWDNGLVSCVMKMPPEATLQYWELPPGCGAEPHNHPESQLTYVQSGVVKFVIDDEEYVFREGCFAYIPSNAVHSSLNIGSTTAVNIDVFMPDREDREDSKKIREFNHSS